MPSSGLIGPPLEPLSLLGLELGDERRGVGADPSLFRLQWGPFQKPSQLVLSPSLADLFIGS